MKEKYVEMLEKKFKWINLFWLGITFIFIAIGLIDAYAKQSVSGFILFSFGVFAILCLINIGWYEEKWQRKKIRIRGNRV